ncbi:MAG TPA: hypothetical protein PLC93_03890 [Rhodocyclaceae bacterium]|uniref:hypothetical protein n=1 Tax=Accumulibacter sp. TaxID=2053492 RepID=UPI002B81735E|nr:hypothetical protein [Accumulibacter sp.]HMZ83412.1 hypothetical protein [Rhodocyclaceae bacterium]HNB69379.1 hypothetical protein [Accumulibacter sp.]
MSCYRKLCIRALSVTVLMWPVGHAGAASIVSSTRWMLLSAPLSPTSYAECQALNNEFMDIVRPLQAEEDACWTSAGQSNAPILMRGDCLYASCVAVCSALAEARDKMSREVQTCHDRVRAYEEEERRRSEAARREERREREAQRKEDRRERATARNRDVYPGQYVDPKVGAIMAIGKVIGSIFFGNSRSDRDRDKDIQRKIEKQNQEIERQQAALRERQAAEQREKQAAEQRERDKADQATYERLVKEVAELKSAANKISTAIDFARNPFLTAAEKGSEGLTSLLTGTAADAVYPGKERADGRYNVVAEVVESARARALSGNPFAEKISGTAMTGIQKIHGKMLNDLDQATNDIKKFGRDDVPVSRGGSAPILRSTPLPSGSQVEPDRSVSYPDRNPFAETEPSVSYYDPDTRVRIEVPSGHVLYREPESRRLVVMNVQEIQTSAHVGDDPKLGDKGCSATGIGIVTPVCEKERRKTNNPFRAR